ncbi:very short patch repair endonuclease [Pusillimonas sp. MFBS29]|uniref:very short patch repair endonuclease n=1 Tax=Pusillimonas sp. MFBS29 TaxID=2886690 RepID=UPI0021023D70|nr:DNA mismatch endonuclease Vsr [Pusillimonas sp. MFBS29]
MMAGIRGKSTKPELLVRQLLFADGFRYRLHRNDLPGTPDIVMSGRKIVIFVHGCFWHQHLECKYARLPASNPDFWRQKLGRNVQRDQEVFAALKAAGWRVLVVWECATRSKPALAALRGIMSQWIEGDAPTGEISLSQILEN